MKNNYRKLKFSILLQTVLVTAVTVLVGGVILNYVIDGVYNESFGRIFVKVLTDFDVEEQRAIDLYWRLIGDNKIFFMIVGFLLLFALFFYVALSKMTRYLDQVGDGIENIISESTEPIHLITELKPVLAEIIKQGIDKGEISFDNPDALAEIVLIVLTVKMDNTLIPSSREEIENTIAGLVSLLEKGTDNPPGSLNFLRSDF